MMKSFLAITALLAVFSTGVFAGGNSNSNGPSNNQGGQGGDAYAGAGAAAGAVAGAVAGANAGASANNTNLIGVGVKSSNYNSLGVSNRNANVGINHQGQSSSNTNLIGGSSQALENSNDLSNRNYMEGQANAQSMTYNEATGVHYSGEYTVKSAPPAVAPGIDPTVPCAIPLTGAGSGIGFGFSVGTAYIDKGCELREEIRLGLSGDSVSQALANQLMQARLRAHLEEADASDPATAEVKKQSDNKSNYAALTGY